MDLERNAPRDTAGEVKDPTAGSVRSTVTKSPFERVSKAVRTNCAAGIGARSSVSDASKMRASGVAIGARGLGRKSGCPVTCCETTSPAGTARDRTDIRHLGRQRQSDRETGRDIEALEFASPNLVGFVGSALRAAGTRLWPIDSGAASLVIVGSRSSRSASLLSGQFEAQAAAWRGREGAPRSFVSRHRRDDAHLSLRGGQPARAFRDRTRRHGALLPEPMPSVKRP
jgi:hypothetical protein